MPYLLKFFLDIVQIKKIHLKNFRCFEDRTIDCGSQFVIIDGKNGSGKTSIIEALHYSCYLKSFRVRQHRELIFFQKPHFFIEVDYEGDGDEKISVGYSEKEGKLVFHNKKPIQSYRELVSHYKIISVTAEDIALVQGAPEVRRDFLNYALLLHKPDLINDFKRYKQVLDQRNALLKSLMIRKKGFTDDQQVVWAQKLWEESVTMRALRNAYLEQLQTLVNDLLQKHFCDIGNELDIKFVYAPRGGEGYEIFRPFWDEFEQTGFHQELMVGRSCFGAHLDDFTVVFQGNRARAYASRGQQKLIVFLIKIAQMMLLVKQGAGGVLLLDDFLTDFDEQRVGRCLKTLQSMPFQVFFTTPVGRTIFEHILSVGLVARVSL